jgi:hypothetical protein
MPRRSGNSTARRLVAIIAGRIHPISFSGDARRRTVAPSMMRSGVLMCLDSG